MSSFIKPLRIEIFQPYQTVPLLPLFTYQPRNYIPLVTEFGDTVYWLNPIKPYLESATGVYCDVEPIEYVIETQRIYIENNSGKSIIDSYLKATKEFGSTYENKFKRAFPNFSKLSRYKSYVIMESVLTKSISSKNLKKLISLKEHAVQSLFRLKNLPLLSESKAGLLFDGYKKLEDNETKIEKITDSINKHLAKKDLPNNAKWQAVWSCLEESLYPTYHSVKIKFNELALISVKKHLVGINHRPYFENDTVTINTDIDLSVEENPLDRFEKFFKSTEWEKLKKVLTLV